MPTTIDRTERIRVLNDELRCSNKSRTWLMTAGVGALGPTLHQQIMAALVSFDNFDPGNDPYCEHDFGEFEIASHRVFFKIDYYDLSGRYHSPDPADPECTRRVLTLMLAEEY